MKILTILLVMISFSACTSNSPTTQTALQAQTSTLTSTQTPAQIPETPLPSPTPRATPLPTLTPVDLVLGPENIGQASQVFEYFESFEAAIGKSAFDVRRTSFDFSSNGQRLAFGICSSNDSSWICSAEAENSVLILDAHSGDKIQLLQLGNKRLAGLALSPDGQTLYTLQTDVYKTTIVQAWAADSGELIGTLFQVSGEIQSLPSLCLSSDGKLIAATMGSLGFTVYSLSDQQVVFEEPGNFGRCDFSSNGQRLFVFLRDANADSLNLAVYQTNTWEDVAQIALDSPATGLMAVAPDGQRVVVNHDTFAAVWDVDSGELVATLEPPADSGWLYKNLALSPDGRLLIVLIEDYSGEDLLHLATAFDTTTWQSITEISSTIMEPRDILFDGSGEQFIVTDWYGEAQRFSLPDENLLAARQTLDEYLDALSSGDYQRAVDLFTYDPELDDTLPGWVSSQGGDPEDMLATFELACLPDAFPCLPLKDVLFSGRDLWDSYLFVVTFKAEDGSAFTGSDGSTDFWLYAGIGEDGQIRMTSLHPGAFKQ